MSGENVIAQVVGKFVSPVEKLISLFGNACGKLYEPIHIKRMAKANSEAVKLLQDTFSKDSLLQQSFQNEYIKIDNKALNDITIRAINRLSYQEICKQNNLENVLSKTYTLLKNVEKVEDVPIDPNWVWRYIDDVETIGNETMQALWAKLLAGEIKTPNTFSLRTLNVLKNMTQAEAVLFEKIASYVFTCRSNIGIDYFLFAHEFIDNAGIKYDELQILSEAGLISLMSGVSIGFPIKARESENINLYNSNLCYKITNITDRGIDYLHPAYCLSESGKQLLKIININKIEKNYLEEQKKFIYYSLLGDKVKTYTVKVEENN